MFSIKHYKKVLDILTMMLDSPRSLLVVSQRPLIVDPHCLKPIFIKKSIKI